MSDPLSLLREQFVNKKPLAHDDTHITIGDLKFPRSILTTYKQDRGRGAPYPLDALYYLLQKPHLAGATKTRAYKEECKLHNFQSVLIADQKDVLAYLTGKQETSQYLVSVEELTTIVPQPSEAPVTAKAAEKAAGEKRKREEPTLDMTDEKMVEAKKDLEIRLDSMAPSLLHGPEEKKKARVPPLDELNVAIEPTTSPYILADAAVTRSILEKERSHLTRTTCLHTRNGKDFKQLHEILRGAIASRKSASGAGSKSKAAASAASNRATSSALPAAGQRRDRYNVSGVEAFKAAGMDATLLQAEQQGSSLLSSTQNQSSAPSKRSVDAPITIKRAPQNVEPIILVPQAASAVITKWNIKDLLEKGQYKTREEQKKAGYKPEERISVMHQEEGPNGTIHTYHYKVVDSAENMKKEDWPRVVAVFMQGPEWQFKQWDLSSFGGKLVNMFQRTCGVHIIFDKEQPHENAKKFSVKMLAMSRSKRHLDGQVRTGFWDHLKYHNRLASQIREKQHQDKARQSGRA
mmetsp:Transcript_49101/g.71996  ORF Transcript_49101/g.71996 Transcript_49101/m.71996 type:complete len:520 (-) Transcript_49101:75-1634(-)